MATTGDIRIRISTEQKNQLKNMVEASGFRNISDYCRSKIFDSDLAIHSKVNKILQILEQKKV